MRATLARLARRLLSILPDKQNAVAWYVACQRRWPNLREPKTFNEKLLWMKLYYRDPFVARCTDKLAVRDVVKETVSEDCLIPLLGVWDDPADIPYDALPEQFVLKATHGSNWTIVCNAKRNFDRDEASKKLKKWLRTNFFSITREWQYRGIEPRILAEQFLTEDGVNAPPDYKIFCFHGRPLLIQVDYDRFSRHTRSFYDLDWNPVDMQFMYPRSRRPSPPPGRLGVLVDTARRLAAPFSFVRVDLYDVRDQVFFGELTFSPENAQGRFVPRSCDASLGAHLDLSELPQKNLSS